MEIVVDLQTVDMEKFTADRTRFQAIHTAADDARKKMDAQFKAMLDHSGRTEVVVGDQLWTANTNSATSHNTSVVAELLGVPFVLNSAKLSQEAVNAEVARRATFDPEGAAKIKSDLENRMVPGFGARVVRSRKLKPAEKKKLEQEMKA